MPGKRVFLFSLFVFWVTQVTCFAAMDVPAKIQAALFFKIFSFDKNITDSADGELKVAVLSKVGNADSESAKAEIVSALNEFSGKTKVGAKSVTVTEISTVADIANYRVVYVTPGNDADIASIVAVCKEKKVLGVTGVESYAQQGLALAIGIADGKPKIIINQAGANDVGSKFSSQIMALAKII